MAPEAIGVLSLLAIMALVLLRIPVAIALGVVGTVGYGLVAGWSGALNRLGNTPFELARGYSLSVVPLFIMMGAVASRSGMIFDLFRATNGLFAGRRGTLAMATVGACAGFSAISGSSLATAATMSRIAIPDMLRFGYEERLAIGSVASGGTLGTFIPPSVFLIIYCIIAQQSVAALFAAALIPGIVLTVLHIVVIWSLVRLEPNIAPASPAMGWKERLRATMGIWQVLLLFGVSVGGIYAGVFSATEGAAVGCVGAIVLGFASRRISASDLLVSAAETVRTTAVLFLIVITAFIYAYFLIQSQVTQGLVTFIGDAEFSPLAVILAMISFYLVLGFFLDALAMILITVPIFLPVILNLGFDPVWFGVLVVLVVQVGLITPPVGMNLFVIRNQHPNIAISTLYRSVLPFLVAHALMLVLLLLFPGLALWLPDAFFG